MSDDEVSTPSVIRKGDGSPVRSALKGNRKTPRPKDGVKFGVVDVKVREFSRRDVFSFIISLRVCWIIHNNNRFNT